MLPAWLAIASGVALGEPVAKSLDQALVDALRLGDAAGCFAGLGVPDTNGDLDINDQDLVALNNAGQLGMN